MNTTALFNALKQLVHFQQEEFDLFVQSLTKVVLKKNEIWEQSGKISQWMGFVNTGVLRQYSLKDGAEYTTDFFIENEFIGNYVSYQMQSPSTTITAAIEASELLVLPFKEFESYYERLPQAKASAEIISKQKLVSIQDRNASLLMDTPEERYYKLMQQKPNLLNRVPQYLIAQYLGIRPESLSRIRNRRKS